MEATQKATSKGGIMYHTTTYHDPHDRRDHEAIRVPWDVVREILGREHEGRPEDDRALVRWLRDEGAPEWVEDAEGWTDDDGWGLIGPAYVTLLEAADYPADDPRRLVLAEYVDLGVALLDDGQCTWAADLATLCREGARPWSQSDAWPLRQDAYSALCRRVPALDPFDPRVREASARHGIDPDALTY